ncbi:PDR/VanB family oxidoreductase [Thauera linaloolentis]|uniref:Ferredoxin n=1 Tax=Thauera linaloolentis (strain DSM 12138 / JCM 21573 / CCUG 41526 / CIP 105981 / IAM 15112 / NBRC 102519 / 47Lol) TaxID=1123367 RepID=N6YYT0_THAL4|nr:PDR/VanB family oxidoreductase [Thauera linaloolentis]ENO85099.1 ferredoxin [Thauera linaloolentis 47Lol = DSM 12138]MCM8566715.1 PDR/VanB family oxidoreductase [Thauera linaloolentis]
MESTQLKVRIVRKAVEATDIVSLELAAPDGGRLPGFSAGSHIDLEVRPGLVRQYSLCNDPGETHRYLIGVLRDPASRGGSAAVHDELAEGQVVNISAPRNHFPLVPAAQSLLFAGGIGITPILCMAERLAQSGADFVLHYCARSVDRAAFLERIRASGFAERVHLHFDDGDAAQKLALGAVLDGAAADAHLYVCGPGGFIDFVTQGAQARGWAGERVHFEYFAGQQIDTSGDGEFDVKLASSGKVVTVLPGKTVVQALRAAGVEIEVSCEQGVCGTCLTRVLDGAPDHRDNFLSDEEKAVNDQFLPCCSRARGLLVLDL